MATTPSKGPSRATSLRRIDWRFLLPYGDSYRLLCLLGGDETVAELLRSTGVATEVTRSLTEGSSLDCIAVLADGHVTAGHAARALAPGGVVWWEVDRWRRPATTPARLECRLRRAGLTPIGTYIVRGRHETSTMYLPLWRPGAVEWYFESFFRPTSRSRRAARNALRVLTRWRGDRLGQIAPRFAVVAVKADRDSREAYLPGGGALPIEAAPAGSQPVLIKSGQGDWSRVVLLPFTGNSAEPSAVLKIPRSLAYQDATLAERDALLRIRPMLDGSMSGSVPEPIGIAMWNGAPITAERFLAGESLSGSDGSEADRHRAVEELRSSAAWLTRFHLQTRFSELRSDELRDSVFRPSAQRFMVLFGGGESRRWLLDAVEGALVGAVAACPIAWQHRDFGPWNLRKRGGEIAVLDWEVARPGPCLTDLLYFAFYWLWLARGRTSAADRAADLRALFIERKPTDFLAQQAQLEIDRYLGALGIDPRMVPLLLVQALMDQALDRHARIVARGPMGEEADENTFVECLEALAREPEALVARW